MESRGNNGRTGVTVADLIAGGLKLLVAGGLKYGSENESSGVYLGELICQFFDPFVAAEA